MKDYWLLCHLQFVSRFLRESFLSTRDSSFYTRPALAFAFIPALAHTVSDFRARALPGPSPRSRPIPCPPLLSMMRRTDSAPFPCLHHEAACAGGRGVDLQRRRSQALSLRRQR